MAVLAPTPIETLRPSRTSALPRPITSVPAAVRAELCVRYRSGPDERRAVELRPWGDKLQLMAHSRGPRDHDCETRLLPLVHDPRHQPVVQALRALAALYFGPTGLVPRILGEPDWEEATLELQRDGDDGPVELLKVQLRIEAPAGLRALVRHSMPARAQTGPVTLAVRPGDADPLHALLRVGFGIAPRPMPGALPPG